MCQTKICLPSNECSSRWKRPSGSIRISADSLIRHCRGWKWNALRPPCSANARFSGNGAIPPTHFRSLASTNEASLFGALHWWTRTCPRLFWCKAQSHCRGPSLVERSRRMRATWSVPFEKWERRRDSTLATMSTRKMLSSVTFMERTSRSSLRRAFLWTFRLSRWCVTKSPRSNGSTLRP